MALITQGTSVLGRQLLISPAPDDTLTLYLPLFGASNWEKVGGLEVFRLSSAVPTGRSQAAFIPIYVDSTRVDFPEGFTTTNHALGAIWYRSGLVWELWD